MIKPWLERLTGAYNNDDVQRAMKAEIDDWRALYAAPAAAPIEDEGDEYTLADPDLNELLNLSADMVKGRGNMDTGLLWLDYLERVQARLAPVKKD